MPSWCSKLQQKNELLCCAPPLVRPSPQSSGKHWISVPTYSDMCWTQEKLRSNVHAVWCQNCGLDENLTPLPRKPEWLDAPTCLPEGQTKGARSGRFIGTPPALGNGDEVTVSGGLDNQCPNATKRQELGTLTLFIAVSLQRFPLYSILFKCSHYISVSSISFPSLFTF